MTFINPHINLSIEWFYAQVYRRKGGNINTDSAAAHPSPQGQELVGFLAPEAGSVSGRQVLSPFSLNQIKSWKQLKAHPLSGLIPSLCLTTNTVSFQAGLVQAAPGQAVAWKVDRASLFPLPCAVRGHDPLSSPGLVNLPALASAPSTWPPRRLPPLGHGVKTSCMDIPGAYSLAVGHLVKWLHLTVPQFPAKWG